ncbi:MAG: hypothetical protein HZA90_02725 [Verrucomicrobia bacterium]|nr:hypothetical protein [Verrucomicrobiota bacterium]
MKRLRCLALIVLTALPSSAATYQWTNTLGGDWSFAANWSPHGIPGPNDAASITTSGTYTVTSLNNATFAALALGGESGTQTLVCGASVTAEIAGTVAATGVLLVTNAGLRGSLTIEPGGQLQLTGAPNKQLYGFSLVNRGTVTWSGGTLAFGGTAPATTTISNGGLWQITGDSTINYGGGNTPTWVNGGTLRKSGGAAIAGILGVRFVNQPDGLVDVLAGTLQIGGAGTNIIAGSFTTTAPGALNLVAGTWTDAGGAASGTGVARLTGGTLLLRSNAVPGLQLTGGDIYIASTFQQAGSITNLTIDGATLRGTNFVGGGTLTFNSGSLPEWLTVQPEGRLVFASSGSKLLYSGTLINRGTVLCTNGSLSVGGTTISNGGLWQFDDNFTVSYGGYTTPNWTNTGILRQSAGSSVASLNGLNFINESGGLVEVQSGTLRFNGGNLSLFGGTFNATVPGLIEITGGTWADAGGVATGTGTSRLNGGTFNFRTNTIPGLRLMAGSVYVIGTNTFQQAGAITNLTLDGASLLGTNRVGVGTLTVNSGALAGRLTVEPNGHLLLATTTSKTLYSLNLINQGTVLWSGGGLAVGGTVVSNGGLWQMTGDFSMSYGGYATPVWTNSGTLLKSAGTGVSSVAGLNFYNQPNALVQVDSGTLQLASTTTNTAGTLRLNGGKLSANGTLAFSGTTFDGSGTVGANALTGGLISPGLGGSGLMSFTSGLNLGADATLTLDGTGLVPGSGYDQLSVTGAVALGNCTLQVTSLSSVATGTTFVLIDNDGVDAPTGVFNGLPEGALLAVSGQLFRVSYHGGSGNDVTLTRIDGANAQPQFSSVTRLGGGSIQLAGMGAANLRYTVLASTNLVTTNWIPIGTVTADGGGHLQFTDPDAASFTQRFFRFSLP